MKKKKMREYIMSEMDPKKESIYRYESIYDQGNIVYNARE
jgi:hypothetical protein